MATGIIISVRVTPRAGRDEIAGVGGDGVLRVRVAASPVDGAANRAVVRLVAAELQVPPSSVELVSGITGRVKRLRIHDTTAVEIRSRWPDARAVP